MIILEKSIDTVDVSGWGDKVRECASSFNPFL